MKKVLFCVLLTAAVFMFCAPKQEAQKAAEPEAAEWTDLFAPDLSNAVFPEGVWSFEDSVLTASEDQAIWTEKMYDNFVLELEFKTAPETNSGVILYCSDRENWIPNSVEIQIADDHSEKWGNAQKYEQCGAVFGHLAASKSMVKQPGEWNQFVITCQDSIISVVLNGEAVTKMNMAEYTSNETNPDGTEVPSWLSKPVAELQPNGYIGLQGKHAGAPIFFRNIRIKEIN
ncbi:DUF1080 domain-containing protein [candidate division KSB1 bacterium]|nr:DUF1080 domain-containing protein [candidate division KSB1 bacterium]